MHWRRRKTAAAGREALGQRREFGTGIERWVLWRKRLRDDGRGQTGTGGCGGAPNLAEMLKARTHLPAMFPEEVNS